MGRKRERKRDEPRTLPQTQTQSPTKLEMSLTGRWDEYPLFLLLIFEKLRYFLSRAWVIRLGCVALEESHYQPINAPMQTCDPPSTHNSLLLTLVIPCTGVSSALPTVPTCTLSVYPTLSMGTYPCSLCYSLAPRGPLARRQSPKAAQSTGQGKGTKYSALERNFSDKGFTVKGGKARRPPAARCGEPMYSGHLKVHSQGDCTKLTTWQWQPCATLSVALHRWRGWLHPHLFDPDPLPTEPPVWMQLCKHRHCPERTPAELALTEVSTRSAYHCHAAHTYHQSTGSSLSIRTSHFQRQQPFLPF